MSKKKKTVSPNIYFDNEIVVEYVHNEYVLWVDVMGSGTTLARSIKMSASRIFTLHTALLENLTDNIKIYPMLDGAYVTCKSQKEMTDFITNVFYRLTKHFKNENSSLKRPESSFLVRGALAYGPVVHGRDVNTGKKTAPPIIDILEENKQYTSNILIGIPVIQAYHAERFAPPYGVYVHESARAFSPEGENGFVWAWHPWFVDHPEWEAIDSTNFCKEMIKFFDGQKLLSSFTDYNIDRLQEHQKLFKEMMVPVLRRIIRDSKDRNRNDKTGLCTIKDLALNKEQLNKMKESKADENWCKEKKRQIDEIYKSLCEEYKVDKNIIRRRAEAYLEAVKLRDNKLIEF